jgi:hypothetical protein
MAKKGPPPDCFDLLLELYEKDPDTNYVARCVKNADNGPMLMAALIKASSIVNIGNIASAVSVYFDKLVVFVKNDASNSYRTIIDVIGLDISIMIFRDTSQWDDIPRVISLRMSNQLDIDCGRVNGINEVLKWIDKLLFDKGAIPALRCAHLTDD